MVANGVPEHALSAGPAPGLWRRVRRIFSLLFPVPVPGGATGFAEKPDGAGVWRGRGVTRFLRRPDKIPDRRDLPASLLSPEFAGSFPPRSTPLEGLMIRFCVLAAVCLLAGAAAAGEVPPAPSAPPGNVVDVIQGERVADPYRWLEDRSDPRCSPGATRRTPVRAPISTRCRPRHGQDRTDPADQPDLAVLFAILGRGQCPVRALQRPRPAAAAAGDAECRTPIPPAARSCSIPMHSMPRA